MPSDRPIKYSVLLEKFMNLENHTQFETLVHIRRWIKYEHLRIGKPIPLELTIKRWANRLYHLLGTHNVTDSISP